MELWPDPLDGLDASDAPWNWQELVRVHDGPTKNPPNNMPGWERWYFTYGLPDGSRVKISADRDPVTGQWYNPLQVFHSTMSTRIKSPDTALERRVRQFYKLASRKKFDKCYGIIDPLIRDDSRSVTLLQYHHSLEAFLKFFGTIAVEAVQMQFHIGQPSRLYSDRDFAVGQTTWLNNTGEKHTFQERWVRIGKKWFTRSTGFVTPR